jgi:putative methylase
MKQRKLEMLLEKVQGFEEPELELEQYQTPPILAAEILHFAYMQGDLETSVQDLGCGTGILAIGAKLLGAKRVVGYDEDPKALKLAEKNAEKMGVEIDFVCTSIEKISECVKTTLMNPPFGARVKGKDRPFLSAALRTSEIIYSIHNRGSFAFVQRFIKPAVITHSYVAKFPIKKTFEFHKKEMEVIEVEVYRLTVP